MAHYKSRLKTSKITIKTLQHLNCLMKKLSILQFRLYFRKIIINMFTSPKLGMSMIVAGSVEIYFNVDICKVLKYLQFTKAH